MVMTTLLIGAMLVTSILLATFVVWNLNHVAGY